MTCYSGHHFEGDGYKAANKPMDRQFIRILFVQRGFMVTLAMRGGKGRSGTDRGPFLNSTPMMKSREGCCHSKTRKDVIASFNKQMDGCVVGGKCHKDVRMFFCEGGQTITFWEEAAAAAIDKWGCFSAHKTKQSKSNQIISNQIKEHHQ